MRVSLQKVRRMSNGGSGSLYSRAHRFGACLLGMIWYHNGRAEGYGQKAGQIAGVHIQLHSASRSL